MGKEAVQFVNQFGDIAVDYGHIPKGACMLGYAVAVGDGAEGEC